jgi:hypothetical protein
MRWLVIACTGCTAFFDGSGDDASKCAEATALVDPFNNTCESFGCAGGDISVPDFATCDGPCTALGEAACLSAPACRATYEAGATKFAQCWSTAPSGPIQGECAGLDAQTCSEHDDCSILYDIDQFVTCQSEISCTSSPECRPGTHCTTDDRECLPPPNCPPNGACTTVCAGHCVLN